MQSNFTTSLILFIPSTACLVSHNVITMPSYIKEKRTKSGGLCVCNLLRGGNHA